MQKNALPLLSSSIPTVGFLSRGSPRQADGSWALKWRSICAFKDGECRGDADTLMKAAGDGSMNPREKGRWEIPHRTTVKNLGKL